MVAELWPTIAKFQFVATAGEEQNVSLGKSAALKVRTSAMVFAVAEGCLNAKLNTTS
jgi:hypothetical protein